LPANITLGRNCIEELNTLAYYDTATIAAAKCFSELVHEEKNLHNLYLLYCMLAASAEQNFLKKK
jgi:hypothetical protein